MPIISVQSNIRDIMREVEGEVRERPAMAARALNTAIQGLKTDAGRELRRRYPKLKLRDVNELISLGFASSTSLVAYMQVRGRPLSLNRFLAKAVKTTKGGAGGVYVNIKGTRKFIPHAWVQTLRNNRGDEYAVLMIRDGKGRNAPVKVLKTIDIPNALNISEVRSVLDNLVNTRFDKEFERLLRVFSK